MKASLLNSEDKENILAMPKVNFPQKKFFVLLFWILWQYSLLLVTNDGSVGWHRCELMKKIKKTPVLFNFDRYRYGYAKKAWCESGVKLMDHIAWLPFIVYLLGHKFTQQDFYVSLYVCGKKGYGSDLWSFTDFSFLLLTQKKKRTLLFLLIVTYRSAVNCLHREQYVTRGGNGDKKVYKKQVFSCRVSNDDVM